MSEVPSFVAPDLSRPAVGGLLGEAWVDTGRMRAGSARLHPRALCKSAAH